MPWCVQATWDDVPHLDQKQKDDLWESIPPHQREARSKGIPMLGAGKVYPVPEEAILCDPFEIPAYWPKAFGFDVGWNRTAAVWGAWDRQSDVVYLYSEHYMGQAPPSVHASAIRARGQWMWGAIDPASRASGQRDGEKLLDEYVAEGLNLVKADNAVEAGIHACYQRMVSGKLKVFRTLPNWLTEFRTYRRDEKGKIVKERDHALDATRYLLMTGMLHAIVEPAYVDDWNDALAAAESRGANATGY